MIAGTVTYLSAPPSALGTEGAGGQATPTPCPTAEVPDTFGGSGCGTPTPTPTSIRLPPMLVIDFTVNDAYEVTVERGQLLSLRLSFHNDDHRGINIDKVLELDGERVGMGHCFISPGSSCAGGIITVANRPGTLKAVARIEAAVDSCGLCPTLSEERSILVHVAGQPGDVNCDGSVDAIDASLILQLTAALIQPFDCDGASDVNHDGFTNALDVALVLQYVAGLIDSL